MVIQKPTKVETVHDSRFEFHIAFISKLRHHFGNAFGFSKDDASTAGSIHFPRYRRLIRGILCIGVGNNRGLWDWLIVQIFSLSSQVLDNHSNNTCESSLQ